MSLATRPSRFPLVAFATSLCLATGLGSTSAAAFDEPAAAVDDDRLVVRTGIVRSYLMNAFGDVDGILAGDGRPVRFPPHMSRDLVEALQPADRFVARGRTLAGGGFEAYSLGREGSRPLVESRPTDDRRPLPPRDARLATLRPMTVGGAVVAILRNPSGDIDGVVIDDGTIVELPPRSRIVATDGLRVGTVIRAAGEGTSNRYGRSLRADAFGRDGLPLVPLQPAGPRLPAPPPDRPSP